MTTLDTGEQFVSVSPSGSYLLTAVDQTHSGRLVGDVCIRMGHAYEERWCVPVDNRLGTWSAAWADDEKTVAFVRAGSERGGERNDVLWVLDVEARETSAITPDDAWLPATTVSSDGAQERAALLPFWVSDGRVGYVWPAGSGVELRAASPDGGNVETLAVLPGAAPTGVIATGESPLLVGTSARGVGVLQWGGDDLEVVAPVSRGHSLLAFDPASGSVIRRLLDAHVTPPPLLETPAGEQELTASAGHVVWAAAFSPDSASLATLSTAESGEMVEVTLRALDAALELPLLSEWTFDVASRTHYYHGLLWTDRGLVLPSSTDGRPQAVLVFALDG